MLQVFALGRKYNIAFAAHHWLAKLSIARHDKFYLSHEIYLYVMVQLKPSVPYALTRASSSSVVIGSCSFVSQKSK
jgi:hypothetical protein